MKKTGTAEWKDRLLWALNERSEKLIEGAPMHVIKLRLKDLQTQKEWIDFGMALVNKEGWRVPKCPRCEKFFIAKRRSPLLCPACSKKQRQRTWRENYEKAHGHPYQQKREPAYVKKVRKALENWKDFEPTDENKKDLAADVDVTLKQCEAALEYLKPTQKKRAGKAHKR